MKKVLWWHLFDGKRLATDEVTLGFVLPREEFSLGCAHGNWAGLSVC